MEFSPLQERAIKTFRKWLAMHALSGGFFYLAGYAGTGKTTIAQHLASVYEPSEIRYAAFTGKAATVMRSKGCKDASTIHSLIYFVEEMPDGTLKTSLSDAKVRGAKLIVIDECSMVDEKIGKDLMSFGIPILVLGDPFQLPPVEGAGFFTSDTPHFMLDEVHRQAEENPILRLATALRTGTYGDQLGRWGALNIVRRRDVDIGDIARAQVVICGRNKTRHKLNTDIRTELGRMSHLPEASETLVCLRNSQREGIYNGEIFTALDVFEQKQRKDAGPVIPMNIRRPDAGSRQNTIAVEVPSIFFESPDAVKDIPPKVMMKIPHHFDYGYAITCHKSQGSQWEDVMVFDESYCFRENGAQWLYTATTRASETLTVVR